MYGVRHSKFRSEHDCRPRPSKKESVDATVTSEIVEHLRICAQELEEKQNRHERLVKISRDVTIDSKRLIFFLHTFQKGTPNAENVLVESKARLTKIVKTHFSNIVNELKDLDIHQYLRAYTFGVQEFIEAFSFYFYLVNNTLLTFEDVVEFLQQNLFEKHLQSNEPIHVGDGSQLSTTVDSGTPNLTHLPYQYYFLTMLDYVLGLSDLTGELMRYCINQVAAGRNTIAFDTCRFLTNLYTGMLSVDCHSRDFNRKMFVFLQNVKKVEMACYTVEVRGTEMPKHMIFSVLDNDDEPHDY